MRGNLGKFIERIIRENEERGSQSQIGYPTNLKGHNLLGHYKGKLVSSIPFLLHYGSPFTFKAPWTIQCMEEEKSLIEQLIAPWGGTQDNTWGYIASGGSESNIVAVKIALKRFSPQKPVLLFSTETHYSIVKLLDLCEHSFIASVKCPTIPCGQMDYAQIPKILAPFLPSDTPIVVVATLGTSKKGASDDIVSIMNILLEMGVRRENLFIHADAALNGGFWHLDKGHYPYQLGKEIDSLAMSGHKWYGSDVCSLFAIYHADRGENLGEYFDHSRMYEPGLVGCRDGFHAISWKIRLLQFDWQNEYDACQEIVRLIVNRFVELKVETLVNPVSITICFPIPPQEIIQKYILPTYTDENLGSISRIIVMPSVTKYIVDSFFTDLSQYIKQMRLKFTRTTYLV